MFINDLWLLGDQNVQVPAHLNFGKFILDRIRRVPGDRIALENVESGEKMTYRELTEYAVKLSVGLTNLGVRRGDVVALGSEKCILFMPTALAIILSGACYTPFDYNCGRAHLQHKLEIAQPKYLICSELLWKTNRETLESCDSIKTFITLGNTPNSMISVRTLICDLPGVEVNKFEPESVHGQTDTAILLYSSGTTGLPKGLKLTHLCYIINCLGDDVDDESLEVVYITADWFHSFDAVSTYKVLGLGKKIVFTSDVTPETVMQTFRKHKVNVAFLYPVIIGWLNKMDEKDMCNIDSLKVVFTGGDALPAKTSKILKQRIPTLKEVYQCYGMTEVGQISNTFFGPKGPKIGSVGVISPGLTLKVIDLQTGKCVGPNQDGELCIRSIGFMNGYIGVDPSTYLDEQGFFKTGDLGHYDEDGYLYIVGRLKDVIIYDGYNVVPLELESILQLHPEVREAAVVGKPVPDYGELPTAFVVRQTGSTVTEQQLLDFVAIEVAPYMQLRGGIKFIDKLPRNPVGKLLRRNLKEVVKEL